MIGKWLALLAIGTSLSAADLPEGWKPFHSVAKNAPAGTAQGTVALDGTAVRISDPGAHVETGITKTFTCPPGEYARITVDVTDLAPGKKKSMEISAYYFPWKKTRAGTTRIVDGKNVLVTGPAPEKNAKLIIYVYSHRPAAGDVKVTIPKVEFSKTPFAAK